MTLIWVERGILIRTKEIITKIRWCPETEIQDMYVRLNAKRRLLASFDESVNL